MHRLSKKYGVGYATSNIHFSSVNRMVMMSMALTFFTRVTC
jgi:hypothetical protein